MDTFGLLNVFGSLVVDHVDDALAEPLNEVRKQLAFQAWREGAHSYADVKAAGRYKSITLRNLAARDGIAVPTRTPGPAPRIYSQREAVQELATKLVGSIDGTAPGDYSPGATLPGDGEIAESYGVRVATVQAARMALVNTRRLTGLDEAAQVLAVPTAPAVSPLTQTARDALYAAREQIAVLSAYIDDALAQIEGSASGPGQDRQR